MSLDIYAGIRDEHGVYGPVMSMMHSEMGNYGENGLWKTNPEYVPGVSMNMSEYNWHDMCVSVLLIDPDKIHTYSLAKLRISCLDALELPIDTYHVQRLIELANICSLGITRRAEKLCVV